MAFNSFRLHKSIEHFRPAFLYKYSTTWRHRINCVIVCMSIVLSWRRGGGILATKIISCWEIYEICTCLYNKAQARRFHVPLMSFIAERDSIKRFLSLWTRQTQKISAFCLLFSCFYLIFRFRPRRLLGLSERYLGNPFVHTYTYEYIHFIYRTYIICDLWNRQFRICTIRRYLY